MSVDYTGVERPRLGRPSDSHCVDPTHSVLKKDQIVIYNWS
jgi:hypothetical protein